MLLLLFVIGGIVYTQSQLYTSRRVEVAAVADKHMNKAQQAVAEIAAAGKPAAVSPSAEPAGASPAVTAALSQGLGTEASPVAVKLLAQPESADAAAEHQKDREIALGIEHNTARLASAALAQNFLLIFQAIIYFLTLIILFMLLENVKKFADAAARSADAARKSAEAAAEAAEHAAKPALRKMPPRYYRKR